MTALETAIKFAMVPLPVNVVVRTLLGCICGLELGCICGLELGCICRLVLGCICRLVLGCICGLVLGCICRLESVFGNSYMSIEVLVYEY